jgi:hypothetical protein
MTQPGGRAQTLTRAEGRVLPHGDPALRPA